MFAMHDWFSFYYKAECRNQLPTRVTKIRYLPFNILSKVSLKAGCTSVPKVHVL